MQQWMDMQLVLIKKITPAVNKLFALKGRTVTSICQNSFYWNIQSVYIVFTRFCNPVF